MRKPEDPVLQRATGAMTRQLDHITRLVDDLLDVARISRGRIELQSDGCGIVHIVTHTAGDYQPGAAGKGVALSIDAPHEPLWVRGDSARLMQVVGNLLHNAVKFTGAGHHIRVGVREDEGHALITVADDGAGMAPALLASLFSPFVQGSQGLGRSSGGLGLGLGLALVKGLVRAHGGEVAAASPGPGLGSTFTVRLPLVAPAGRDAAPDAQAPVRADRERSSAAGFDLHLVKPVREQELLEALDAVLAARGPTPRS